MARAVLEDPEMLEEWDRDRAFHLRGQRVPVSPTPTEMMLCVARLPLTYTETQFTALVRTYGDIYRSFLMISEKTGDSKGYGFVEYTTKEAALQAKNMLDGKQVENWILCCDWLDSSHITFDSLHSKCLYVDKLPKDFRDMGEFRKVFGSVVNPPYCQIALKNGCPQDWGLVEYSTSEDAENAQTTLNGFSLHGQSIRICYYIPGVRAINLYLKLLNDSGNKGKATGLLPDPPAPAVFQQLQNLAKQNPVFAQSLQNIIWTQIQALQTGSENGKKGNANGVPPVKSKAAGSNMPGAPAGMVPASGTSSTPPAPAADNAQAALVILLAAQMQAQMGSNHPSLLGNPQMLATLQNLIRQHQGVPGQCPGPGHGPTASAPNPSLLAMQAASMTSPAASHYQFPQNHGSVPDTRKALHGSGMKNGFMKPNPPQKVPLLPNPSTVSMSPPPGEVAPRPPFPSPALEDATNAGILGMSPLSAQVPIQDPTNFWNGILGQIQNQQQNLNLPQLDPNLVVKNGFYDHGLAGHKTPLHTDKPSNAHFQQQVVSAAKKLPPHSHTLKQGGGMLFTDIFAGDLQQTISTFLSNPQNLDQILGSLSSAIQTNGTASAGIPVQRQVLSNPPGFTFIGQPGQMLQALQPPQPQAEQPWAMSVAPSTTTGPQSIVTMAAARPILGSPVAGGRPILSTAVPAGRPILGSPVPMAVPQPKPLGFLDVKAGQIRPSPFQNGWAPGTFLTSPTIPGGTTTQFGTYSGPSLVPSLWSHPGSPILIASPPGPTAAGLITPIGQKRKYNRLLPSPEPSPEGNYIGQHSQGLGGHYADSYFKRKKKN
ncbi:ribonucleoprotein PTB-binding 1-like isoform X4 [Zootermopsis nevadensis]|nr:ribonucleoprotein PTB-binding 1-like isoform X4 [Zootermopsis nevadensis]